MRTSILERLQVPAARIKNPMGCAGYVFPRNAPLELGRRNPCTLGAFAALRYFAVNLFVSAIPEKAEIHLPEKCGVTKDLGGGTQGVGFRQGHAPSALECIALVVTCVL